MNSKQLHFSKNLSPRQLSDFRGCTKCIYHKLETTVSIYIYRTLLIMDITQNLYSNTQTYLAISALLHSPANKNWVLIWRKQTRKTHRRSCWGSEKMNNLDEEHKRQAERWLSGCHKIWDSAAWFWNKRWSWEMQTRVFCQLNQPHKHWIGHAIGQRNCNSICFLDLDLVFIFSFLTSD